MSIRCLLGHTARIRPERRVISQRKFGSCPTLRTGDRPTHFTNILAGAHVPAVQIKNVTSEGVHLEDGLIISSACLFIEGKVFLWNVPSSLWQGWKLEHFEVFDTIVPKPGEPEWQSSA